MAAATTLGRPRLHLRSTDSTNERARELAAAGAPHGTLVTAGHQSAGRGRQGRVWSAPAGRALLMSLLLRGAPTTLLPLVAAVAVCDAVGSGARIKWPNDVLLEDAKVAGILVEARVPEAWAVVGIGLNVAVRPEDLPPELRGRAATLGLEPEAMEEVLSAVVAGLEHRLVQDPGGLLEDYRARDALRGRAVTWAQGSGVGAGVDAEGRLLVDHPDGGRSALRAGEVHLAGGAISP